ncbi:MAG: phosphotransferase [Caldilineaceae bacterium]
MHRHPYFDLWLDNDAELECILGIPIRKRTTLREWPLSCVQRLNCGEGRSLIYKVQAPPTVEPLFYANAESSLLASAQIVSRSGMPDALILEDMQGKPISDCHLNESSALEMIDQLLAQISAIRGDLPALESLHNHQEWFAHGEKLYETLSILIDTKQFDQLTLDAVNRIKQAAHDPELLALFDGPIGYLHGDLSNDNVLLVGNSFCVLDWQRPFWGPIALDRSALLRSLGLDAAKHVGTGVAKLETLLTIDWFAACASTWFPAGVQDYEVAISRLIQSLS